MALLTLQQVRDALNLGSDTSHDTELELYVDAAAEHLVSRGVNLSSAQYTEDARFANGRILTRYWPVLTVVSLADDYGTSYTSGFTIGDGRYDIEHDSIVSGVYRVTYTAGFTPAPADLKIAALEDIRGLYQPGQIGPAAAFGAFGVDSVDTGTTYRPVRMWPRLDAWVDYRLGPAIA